MKYLGWTYIASLLGAGIIGWVLRGAKDDKSAQG